MPVLSTLDTHRVSLNILSTSSGLTGWEVQLEKNQQEFQTRFHILVVVMPLFFSSVDGRALGCLYIMGYS